MTRTARVRARSLSGVDEASVKLKSKGCCGVKQINCEICLLCLDCDGGSDEEKGTKEDSNENEEGLTKKQKLANLRSR